MESRRLDNSSGCDNKRRKLLKLSGLLGLSTMAGSLLPTEQAEALWFDKKQYKVSQTKLAMGTFVAMTAIHPSRDQAEEAFGRAFDEVNRLGLLLSRHNQSSPIAELNRSGVLVDVPVEVSEVIEQSLLFHNRTGGGFDITVKPLLDLYQQRFDTGKIPSGSEIEGALKGVGSTQLRVSKNRISFAKPGMGITLDGIAKGYIVDRASEVLSRYGIKNHLINAGGDIRTSGAAAKGSKWTVAIQDPNKNRAFPDLIKMGDGAVATSGNYEVFYDNEKLFHHIVDGRSGRSPQLAASVTVKAPTVMEADALSTTLFVLEASEGLKIIENSLELESFILNRNGSIKASSSWQS